MSQPISVQDIVLVAPCGFAKAKIDYAKVECFLQSSYEAEILCRFSFRRRTCLLLLKQVAFQLYSDKIV